MPTKPSNPIQHFLTSATDAKLARESSRRLAPYLANKRKKDIRLRLVQNGDRGETIAVPQAALRLLHDILNEMGQGNAVKLLPIHAELTTQQAADLLNVSRPFMIGLLDECKLPCRKVGTHRRVLLRDLLEYKHKIDADRLRTLAALSRQAQQLDMGY